ncbi:MAG: transporter substrate-binding domain-containing protein [Aliarcobacter sp.]|nr:transporter substrate-binding domain-containing protein [Aliarcobacter sp.]
MKTLIIIFLFSISLFAKEADFKISYDPNYAPFSYKQDDKAAGLFVDIWKLWAKYNNYTIEFVDGVLWEDAINLVKDKKVDFFLGTEEYNNWMVGSNFFYEIKSSFFALAGNDFKIEKKENLNIGIIGNVYKELMQKNFPNANIKIYEDYIYSINDLKELKIDVIYDDKLAIEFYTVQNNFFYLIKPLNNLILKNKIRTISYDKEKADIFNAGLLKIPTNELLELEKKWILNENERYYPDFKQQINLTKEEKDFLAKNLIKVSVSNSWEPFTFKSENDEAIGISSEYWKLIASKLGLNYKNSFSETFNQQINSIKDKESDLIYSVGETTNRKEFSIFTKEYAKFPISIITKKDENFIENITALNKKKIAVGNNFTAHNIIKNKYPDMDLILVNSVKEGLELVSNNKAYAFIDIQPVLLYNIAKYGFDDLKVSGNTGLDFNIKFMIRGDYSILESILNKAISSISINELNQIISKWDNVQFQTTFNYDLFWKGLFVIFIIILAFINRTLTLKKLNKNLTKIVEEKTKKLNEMNKNLEEMVEKKTGELIQKENILNQQSKMAAMGEMIENIAHQWRQPLSLISTAATGAKLKKDFKQLSDEDFYETMDIINNSAQHLSSTIDDFRNFFNNDKQTTTFDINVPIEKVIYLVSSKLKNREIEIIKNTQEINILGLSNEFIQVLLNILNNALDAFKENNFKEKFIFIDAYKKDNKLILKIKDNAGGIKEDIISRIFEPYFTTKHQSQGTGIGLYMSTEIIKKHMNGNLSVSNKEYTYNNIKCRGAQFKIELPIKE